MHYKNLYLPLLLISAVFLHSCGSTGSVTVVQDSPRTETVADESTDIDIFRQLTIGLIDPVTNFDPLFTEDLSTMRALSLIYEGLFTFTASGELKPALASSYTVSDDQREFEIQLNRDRFFHDSNVFVSGVGRRIHANDIKWAFERTALANIPPTAGKLLMNVEGYEQFYLEQRQVYDVSKRVLNDVSGIAVRNADKIVFRLKEPDPDFLKKLASPFLFIYPREAVQRSGSSLSSRPVGTGLYSFSNRENNRITLTKRASSEAQRQLTDRIDLVSFQNEGQLFQQFILGNIDFIPEVGPSSSNQLLSDSGQLVESYREQFSAVTHEAFRSISLHVNSENNGSTNWLKSRLTDLNSGSFEFRADFIFNTEFETDTTETTPSEEYYIKFTDDMFARSLFSQINNTVIVPGSELSFVDIRAVFPETSLYSETSDSFHKPLFGLRDGFLTSQSGIITVYHNHVSGVEQSIIPWLIDIKNISVDASQQ